MKQSISRPVERDNVIYPYVAARPQPLRLTRLPRPLRGLATTGMLVNELHVTAETCLFCQISTSVRFHRHRRFKSANIDIREGPLSARSRHFSIQFRVRVPSQHTWELSCHIAGYTHCSLPNSASSLRSSAGSTGGAVPHPERMNGTASADSTDSLVITRLLFWVHSYRLRCPLSVNSSRS